MYLLAILGVVTPLMGSPAPGALLNRSEKAEQPRGANLTFESRFAGAQRSAQTSASAKRSPLGCYVNDKWYPEGAIYPPQQPGRVTATVITYVCREGNWAINKKTG
jgi:hypothetical protein